MKKMKASTKSTIISSVIALAMLAGGVALGANADNIVDFAADKLGYEKVIEEEKPDETDKDSTAGETDKEQSGDETTGGDTTDGEGSGETTTE